MLFPTMTFAVFFLVVFLASWALRHRPESRKWVLVVASYAFYAGWDWRFCFLLLGSSLLNYTAGRLIAASSGRARDRWRSAAVVLNLIPLGFFKYYNFFVDQFDGLMAGLGVGHTMPLLDLVLPVAISFFTFHGISYVVDVHRGTVRASRSLADLMLYLSFFPQLVAGPIVRASMFMPQLERPVDPAEVPVGRALLLIVLGLFKKVVVANLIATGLVDPVFLAPAGHGTIEMLFAAWGYAVQIYCDFSAYTDIATGVALLLGYRFPKNFDQPYRAASIRDFWHRWHMSLSTWLREYLYIQWLGGNRGGRLATYRNLMATMVLGGLWHGAGWTFLVWGTLHGLALTVERAVIEVLGRPLRLPAVLSTLLVFHFVCFTWIFFRAPDIATAAEALAAFADWGAPLQHLTPVLAGLIVAMLATQFLPPDLIDRLGARIERLPAAVLGVASGALIIAIDAFGPEGVAPFIYFQF